MGRTPLLIEGCHLCHLPPVALMSGKLYHIHIISYFFQHTARYDFEGDYLYVFFRVWNTIPLESLGSIYHWIEERKAQSKFMMGVPFFKRLPSHWSRAGLISGHPVVWPHT